MHGIRHPATTWQLLRSSLAFVALLLLVAYVGLVGFLAAACVDLGTALGWALLVMLFTAVRFPPLLVALPIVAIGLAFWLNPAANWRRLRRAAAAGATLLALTGATSWVVTALIDPNTRCGFGI